MPPKVDKKSEKGQQKALEKEKQKVADDKTFGLKNKNKSKAVQKYIKGVQAQAKPLGKGGEQQKLQEQLQQKQLKKHQVAQAALLASLFKGVESESPLEPEAPKTNPQAIKQEQKINFYVDQRDLRELGAVDLRNTDAIRQFFQNQDRTKPYHLTEITCKHFLNAVEKNQYGWFWTCPDSGDNCKYRHCLPQGYVFKNAVKTSDEDDEEVPIEELIEMERIALPAAGTLVDAETFNIWRQQTMEKKKQTVGTRDNLTGRDLFHFDPSLFVDDEDAAEDDLYLLNDDDSDDDDVDDVEGDNVDGDNVDGDNVDGDNVDGDNVDGDNVEGDNVDQE